MKAAIFYFTMSGNTELAAKEVAEATGAPLVRLHAEPPYTVDDIDWTHPDARCTREHKDHSLLPRVDFSHYFRWLFANFRECSLIS